MHCHRVEMKPWLANNSLIKHHAKSVSQAPPGSGHFRLHGLRPCSRGSSLLTSPGKCLFLPAFSSSGKLLRRPGCQMAVSVVDRRIQTGLLTQCHVPVEKSAGGIWIPGNWDDSGHIRMVLWQHGTICEHFDKHFTRGECVGGQMSIFMLWINMRVWWLPPCPSLLPPNRAMRKSGGHLYRYICIHVYIDVCMCM